MFVFVFFYLLSVFYTYNVAKKYFTNASLPTISEITLLNPEDLITSETTNFSFSYNTTNTDNVIVSYVNNQTNLYDYNAASVLTTSNTQSVFTAYRAYHSNPITYTVFFNASNQSNFHGLKSYTLPVTCFLEDVSIVLYTEVKKAKDIVVGDKMFQNSREYSIVKRIKKSEVNEQCILKDRRIFSDESGFVKVTYWHKVKFENEDWTFAGEHSKMHEIFPPFPFFVYHFELESVNDTIQIENVPNILFESLIEFL